jgi:hypothetical protein
MANWKVLEMNHQVSDGYVVEVTTVCEKKDGPGYARKVFISEYEGVPGTGYIPYEDLTEEVVLSWVKDDLGAGVVLQTETNIDAAALANKEAIVNPPLKSGVPWV